MENRFVREKLECDQRVDLPADLHGATQSKEASIRVGGRRATVGAVHHPLAMLEGPRHLRRQGPRMRIHRITPLS